jgi:hypothetical protein
MHIIRMPWLREDRRLGPVERQTRDARFSRVKGDGKISMCTSGTRPCSVILGLDQLEETSFASFTFPSLNRFAIHQA